MTIPGIRFALLMAVTLLWGFKDALWGVLAVSSIYHFDPTKWWWGAQLPALSYSFYVSVACLGFFALHIQKYDLRAVFSSPPILLMIAIFIGMALRFDPVNPVGHSATLEKNLKSFAIMIVIAATVRTPGRFKMFVWFWVLGSAGWGLEAWRNPRRQSGRLYGVGSVDADLDNFLAAHWAMCVPFLISYILHGKKWERNVALVAGAFVLNGIILSSSRGGFVALVAGAGVYMLGSLKVQKVRKAALALSVVGIAIFFTLVDQVFLDRVATLWQGEAHDPYGETKEMTGAGRTIIWKAGIKLVADHPFGVGGDGFKTISGNYIESGISRAAHNTYIKMAADFGIHTLILFLLLLFVMFRNGMRGRDPGHATCGTAWVGMPLAFAASMCAFAVTDLVADRFSYELFFWFVALASALPACVNFVRDRVGSEEGMLEIEQDWNVVAGVDARKVILGFAASLLMIL